MLLRRGGIIKLISKYNQNPYCRYYRCLYAAQRKLMDDNHVFKWVDEAFTDEIQYLKFSMLYEIGQLKNPPHLKDHNHLSTIPHVFKPTPEGISMIATCHTFYLTLTIMNKTIINTYGIVYVPDVGDFMDTLEFNVMMIVQRINDVDFDIRCSS
ncbi:hypothetical protein N665_0040s0051 [Sinapis alba]|nr:hypothetical protein N665_0040s0051 [Sinapis alba]